MHPLVVLVKDAIEEYIRRGNILKTPEQLLLPDDAPDKAGVFVCLKKKGELRGCLGTIEPVTGSIPDEAIRNALASATEDPRFNPVGEHELDDLDYSVDIIYPPEKITNESELDTALYGVIVEKGQRRGLLLPDIEGVNTVKEQLRIARMKAGIGPHEPVQLYRFQVKRFK